MATVENAAVRSSPGIEHEAFAPDSTTVPNGWHPLTRLGFRVCFIYFCCIIYLYGDFSVLFTPHLVDPQITSVLTWPISHLGLWAGRHIFRIRDLPDDWRVIIPGDALINWVLDRMFIAAAVIGGLVWTAIAHLRRSQRTEYETMLSWIRFFLRLTVAFFMVGYGMIKVFPLQMRGIPLAVLNEPLGQLSPHTLLWSFIGLHPLYEIICGATEVLAGTMVLFRRTALAGSLLCVFIMSNVVLYNFFFGVQIKLFALNLLLAAIFLVLPDTKPLLDFFWYRRPSIPADNWAPESTRWGVRAYVRMLEIVFIVASLILIPYGDAAIWNAYQTIAHTPLPLLGTWRVDDPHAASGPFKTPKATATEFSIENINKGANAGYLLFSGGKLTWVFLDLNHPAGTLRLNDFFTYRWQMPDDNHLVLTAVPPKPSPSAAKSANSANPSPAPSVITFTRVSLPAHYPLLEYPFQWVVFR